ncbi:FMN-binding protein, partial [Pantoea sp. ANP04]
MAPREFPSLAGALGTWVKGLVVLLSLVFGALPLQAKDYEVERQRIEQFFPDVQSVSEPEGDYRVRTLRKGDEVLGYAFQSINVTQIPAYSGKPINMQVLLDPQGVIRDAYVLEHHEPILLIGIPEQKLHDFNAKYQGIRADQRVVVGRSSDSNAVTIDAVTGATVTVMVVNEIVMR